MKLLLPLLLSLLLLLLPTVTSLEFDDSSPPEELEVNEQQQQQEPQTDEPEQFDFLASIQAFSHLKNVASIASTLVDNSDPDIPTNERIHNIASVLSAPALRKSLGHVFSHADKLLKPEMIDLAISFVESATWMSEPKQATLLSFLGASRTVITPEFKKDFVRAKKRIESVIGTGLEVDFQAWFERAASAAGWIMKIMDPEYMAKVNQLAGMAWEALQSEPVVRFRESMTDPEKVSALIEVLERVQRSLTPERTKRIRALVIDSGLLEMGKEGRKVLGQRVAEKVRWGMTEEGMQYLQRVVDGADVLLTGREQEEEIEQEQWGMQGGYNMIGMVGAFVQMRAISLTPYMAEDVHVWLKQTERMAETLPAGLEVAQAFISMTVPLLDPLSRGERVLGGQFGEDLSKVMAAIMAIPMASLAETQLWLDSTLRLLEPEKVGGVRVLVADLSEILATSKMFESGMKFAANASGMMMMNLGMGLGMEMDVQSMAGVPSLLSPQVREHLSALLHALDATLVPGEVEKTRDAIGAVAAALSVVVEVFEASGDDPDYEFYEEL